VAVCTAVFLAGWPLALLNSYEYYYAKLIYDTNFRRLLTYSRLLPPPVQTGQLYNEIHCIYTYTENLNIKDESPSMQGVTTLFLIQAAGTKALGSFNTMTFMKWKFYVVV
jgi:hypothetical protein